MKQLTSTLLLTMTFGCLPLFVAASEPTPQTETEPSIFGQKNAGVQCSAEGTSCWGLFDQLFLQIYTSENGSFRLNPRVDLLDLMNSEGLANTCTDYASWFFVRSDDGDGGEQAMRNSITIASLTNQRVRFYVAPISNTDNTCRITGFHRWN